LAEIASDGAPPQLIHYFESRLSQDRFDPDKIVDLPNAI